MEEREGPGRAVLEQVVIHANSDGAEGREVGAGEPGRDEGQQGRAERRQCSLAVELQLGERTHAGETHTENTHQCKHTHTSTGHTHTHAQGTHSGTLRQTRAHEGTHTSQTSHTCAASEKGSRAADTHAYTNKARGPNKWEDKGQNEAPHRTPSQEG